MEEKNNIEDINVYLNKKKMSLNDRSLTFNESSFMSSFLPKKKNQFRTKTIDEMEYAKNYIKFNSNDFGNINPLRDVNKKNKSNRMPTKERAIMESVVNLKLQFILYNIRDFIRKFQIKTHPNINHKTYKILVFIRNISLFIYGIIIFFEKPWFCYDEATIPLPKFFNFTRNCSNIAFVGLPFLQDYIIHSIEFLIQLIILIVQIFKYKNEFFLKDTNIGVNKNYNIIQIILFISLFLCLIDIFISLFTGNFPIINFILRAFIYVYMIRRIRRNWVRIFKLFWRTKTIFFFLFAIIFLFSMIGYFLFKTDNGNYFSSFHQAVLQLYILLSTCNFPDIMLETLEISKLAIFYFIIYISINYFIILSYLKTLYYTKYYIINKEDCLNIIRYIIENDFNKDIFKLKQFKNFLISQKNSYSLTDSEYNNIIIVLNLNDENNDLFNDLSKIVKKSPEDIMITNTLFGQYILRNKILEIIINLICFITLIAAHIDNVPILSFQFVMSVILVFELYFLIKNLGFKRFFFRHFNRVVFHIFNIIIIIIIFCLIVTDAKNKNKEYKNIFKIYKIFISLRIIRIFVFLDKFQVIKNIYFIIRNSKEMFYRNLFTLYSLFLLFSTFSILLTGGHIEKDSFNDKNNDSIPEDYSYINFNDFASSFITCFCLLMINNLNILIKSLTHDINTNKTAFQFYFATFYFLSTLIIINIIETLLLELYLNSGGSFNDKEKKEEIIDEEVKEGEDEDDNDDDEEK